MLDPNEFIISRKRKKYKFAKFANSPLCFEFDEWQPQSVDCLEVGAGTGLFSVELAKRYPQKTFVAIDVKGDRLQKGAYAAIELGLNNVWFIRMRADQIDQLGFSNLEQIWITFPDPFPKKRSAGRRLTHANFLKKYAAILDKNGAIYLKHDNEEFFKWSLEQFVQAKWCIKELSFDLHESSLASDYKVFTTYEQRWLEEGRKTHFLKVGLNS